MNENKCVLSCDASLLFKQQRLIVEIRGITKRFKLFHSNGFYISSLENALQKTQEIEVKWVVGKALITNVNLYWNQSFAGFLLCNIQIVWHHNV